MLSMKTIKIRNVVLTVLAALPWTAYADAQGAAAVKNRLESEYKPTKTNDDKSDVVTAGSVLLLHKDKVLMVAASSTGSLCTNTYRDGKLIPSKACKVGTLIKWSERLGHPVPGADKVPATRAFVAGETFWVTKIDVRGAGRELEAVFDFFTGAIPANDQGIRYKGQLMIPFGALTPTPDEALKRVAEVITVVPPEEDAKKDSDKAMQSAPQGGQQEAAPPSQAAPPPAPAPAEPTPAPIEPPPPPPPAPTEVSEGQTIDQVVAALGQPLNTAKVGNKVIYTYKNLKVTFVNGKVKDIQ
jgi:hypothetical protein